MLLLRRIILKEIKIARGILQFYYKTLKPLEINAAILYHYYARIATGGVLSPDAPKKYRRNTMKNISRILALVLALTMVIGAFASVSAAKATWYNDAVTYLESVGVADIGTKAEAKITRAEFALMVAKIDSTWVNTQWWDENGVLADTVVFKDQADTDKAHRAAICYAYQRALIAGDGDGNFRPNATITLAEASVVVVRLMGFQNDVPENGDQWEYNWIYAANKFCHAFNRVFMSNVDTVNPKYELSYGEAAYLLATILNWGSESDDVLCLTKKGENLGKNFPWGGAGTSSGIVRVNGLKMDATNQVVTGGTTIMNDDVVVATNVAILTVVGSNGAVSDVYPVDVDELEKLVRVSLGLSERRDTTSDTLDTFNLGDYVQNGTLLKIKRVDDKVTAVSLFSEQTGAKSVSDTFLVDAAISESKNSINAANREYSYDGSVKKIYDGGVFKGYAAGLYPKYANAISGSANATPQLPLAYTSATYTDADGATQYTHAISFAGKKLVYKGASDKAVEYTIVTDSRAVDENEIVVYSINNWEPLDAADVKAIIPNTAKGEARVEFYDVDGDGYYDIAVVIDSTVFGEDGRPFKALEGDNIVGDATATGYKLKNNSNTGKIQLVVYETSTSYKDSSKTPFYQNIAVATINSGIISAVETSGKKTINGKEYFVCTVATIGNVAETKTVYVPVDGGATETKITYTIAGAKNTIKVDSTGWTSFLDKETTGTLNEVLTPEDFKGLVYNKAVKYVLASELNSKLTGDAANVVVYLKDTEKDADESKGFIVKVEKTETGENTFKVTLATTGAYGDPESTTVRFDNVLDARFSYVQSLKTGGNSGWAFSADADTGLTDGNNNWTKGNFTPRQALTFLGFDAEKYFEVGKTRDFNPELTNHAGTKIWVDWANGNAIAYARDILRSEKVGATVDNMDTILGKTLKDIDAMMDANVTDIEKAETSGTKAWKFLVNLCKTTRILDIEKDNRGARKYADDYATAKKLYEEVTFGDILEELSVFGFDKATFYKNVVTDYQGVGTCTVYGYYLCFIDRIFGGGLAEKALFDIDVNGNTTNWSRTRTTPVAGYVDEIISKAGATGVKTYEVRASASVLWDIENAGIYNRIFATNTNAIRPGVANSKVTNEDLIYVTIRKDASAQTVLKYDASIYDAEVTTSYSWANAKNAYNSNGKNSLTTYNASDYGRYAFKKTVVPVMQNWEQYKSIILVSEVDTTELEKAAKDAFKEVLDTKTAEEIKNNPSLLVSTATADVTVAKDPYYAKTPDETVKFVRYWTKGTATALVTITPKTTDSYKTYLPVVDKTGAQIKVLTEAEAQVWRNTPAPDGMTYEVIDKLLYRVNTVEGAYVFDANGKPEVEVKVVVATDSTEYPITWDSAASVVTDDEVKEVSTVESRALDPVLDKDTYLPGYYEVKFDGETYTADESAVIVVMKPNAATGNLDGSTTTLKAFTEAGKDLFVSYEQVAVTSGDLIALSVIGEYTDGIEAPAADEETSVVYLAKSGTTLEATEYGKDVIVKSTYAAVEVPSGKEVGSIYFKYSTYAEAAFATSINATIKPGFYVINKDGEINAAATKNTAKAGAIRSIDAQGNLKVEITNDNGKTEVVDGTNFKWEFFYTDFEGNFKKAGDSTAVTLVNFKTSIQTQIDTLQNNIKSAQTEYDKIVAEEEATGEKRTAAKITAKENIAKAEKALADYKASVETKNLNGKFWGTANSPAYTYVLTYKYTYQVDVDRITFQYVVVDGTYCVIVNTILQ